MREYPMSLNLHVNCSVRPLLLIIIIIFFSVDKQLVSVCTFYVPLHAIDVSNRNFFFYCCRQMLRVQIKRTDNKGDKIIRFPILRQDFFFDVSKRVTRKLYRIMNEIGWRMKETMKKGRERKKNTPTFYFCNTFNTNLSFISYLIWHLSTPFSLFKNRSFDVIRYFSFYRCPSIFYGFTSSTLKYWLNICK